MKSRGSEPPKEASDAGRFLANRITLVLLPGRKFVAAGSWTGCRAGQERECSGLWAMFGGEDH